MTGPIPFDLDAEESLLGACLLSREAITAALAAGIEPGDFYKPAHALIYRAILEAHAAGEHADPIVLAARLNGTGDLIGGPDTSARQELMRIQAATPASANSPAYARIVRDLARRRDVMSVATVVLETARAGGDLERVGDLVESLRRDDADPARMLMADQIESRLVARAGLANLPKPRWLAKSWIHAGGLVVLYGRWGSCKTFLALGLSCCVSTGSWWHHALCEQGPTIYIAAEGAGMFDARVDAWEMEHGKIATDLYVLPHAINLLDAAQAEALGEVARRIGAVQVTVDTLNRCMIGGDENSPRDMSMFVTNCDRIREISGANVTVVHHDSRAGGNPRGHSSLDGAADTVIEVTKDSGVITVTQTKQKDAPEAPPLTLKLEPRGESATLVDGTGKIEGTRLKTLTALIETATPDGITSTVWRDVSECQHRTFYRAQKWLLDHDYCHNISVTKTPRYAPTEAGTAALLTPTDKD